MRRNGVYKAIRVTLEINRASNSISKRKRLFDRVDEALQFFCERFVIEWRYGIVSRWYRNPTEGTLCIVHLIGYMDCCTFSMNCSHKTYALARETRVLVCAYFLSIVWGRGDGWIYRHPFATRFKGQRRYDGWDFALLRAHGQTIRSLNR